MSSPEVWADARAIIADGAAQLGLPVSWPNERFDPPEPPGPWLHIEFRADAGEPIELGPGVWLEDGAIELSVVVPSGSGIDQAVTLRRQAADWFRGLPPRPVVFDRFAFHDGGDDEEGNWHRLPLRVFYRFQSF